MSGYRRRTGGASRIAVLVAAGIAAVVVVLVVRRTGRFPAAAAASAAFPVPREAPPRNVDRRDLVGAARCASCHAEQFAMWQRSTHGRAGGITTAALIAPFDGAPIRFADATVVPRRAGARAEFVVRHDDGVSTTFTVDGVIGGAHMAGGGTQGFVTRARDGTYRFLPFDYSGTARRWFCNTESRAERGWLPINADLPLEACGDWTPVRVLGDVARFANCQSCHASAAMATFDTVTHRFDTRFASLAIDCESCHGPAREHVALAERGALDTAASTGLTSLATLDKETSLAVCWRCHAVKDQLRPGFVAGAPVERYYSLALPLLGDRPLTPDGRVRTFAYQEGHRYSACYLEGGMRCTDCHDPHSQQYRDVNGVLLDGRFDDRQCTACHPSKGDEASIAAHTHHAASSPGSRCVACHMPYRQQPEVGNAIPYARSDHSIAIPRPLADSAAGLRTACAACHRDASVAALDAQVARWYGALAPHAAVVDAQIRAEAARGPTAAALLLAADTARTTDARSVIPRPGGVHALARAAGVARLIDRYLAGETDLASEDAAVRLGVLARDDPDVDVQALSLAALHLVRGDAAATRAAGSAALERAGPRDAALRDRWSVALGYIGDRHAGEGRFAEAIAAYRAALAVRPGGAALYGALANAERDGGRVDDAVGDYARSLAADPAQPLALVNLGIAEAARGDTAAAIRAWTRARTLDPFEPLASFNLANVLLVRGATSDAIAAYRAALASDGSLTAAWTNLARAYAVVGRFDEAVAAARAALRFGDRDARALLAQIDAARRASGSSR